jgi:hypothetical protein
MTTRKASYTPIPEVPAELMPRLAAIVEVLAGMKTVSEAARSLGLSRNHFQSILHRALLAMVQSITVKAGGRPAKPQSIAALEKELRRLQRENARLQGQVHSTERLLAVAGGLLKGRIRPTARARRARKTTGVSGEPPEDSEPERWRERALEAASEMRRLGCSMRLAATIAGVDVATLRRWRTRVRQRRALIAHRCAPIACAAAARVIELVRALHGLIGVESLRHSVAGLTRHTVAHLKSRTLSAMERERKSALIRLSISQPGVLRGFDAMHLTSLDGPLKSLIGGDAAVPFRTSCVTAKRCDAGFLARALAADFERHGAPLVLRFDRARAHDASAVQEVLDAYQVMPLHGPPHYPCFYGQLERQNREHRAWLSTLRPQSRAALEPCLAEMLVCVNQLWRRRSLNWQTAGEAWNARPKLNVDRHAFREEVLERAQCIAHRLKRHPQPVDLAERLALQQTLERMGYLRHELGGWC